jgi:hypothetical protein
LTEETSRLGIRKGPSLRYRKIKEAVEGGESHLRYSEQLNLELSRGTLLDFETKDPENEVPITIGTIHSNDLIIYQLLNENYSEFDGIIKSIEWREPLIAFNVDFEKSILERIGVPSKAWKELQQAVPYKDDQGEWQHFDKALMKKEFFVSLPPIDYMVGKVVPYLWKLYLLSGDPWEKAKLIYNIVSHNRQCLLKELTILLMAENIEPSFG